MNTQRIFEAMALKVSLDQKKLDDELERVVNSDVPLETKLFSIESVLQRMVKLDGIVAKLNEVIQITNNINKDVEKHQDTKNN